MSENCNMCSDSSTTVVDGICRACDMDWEWFMNLKVVDLELRKDGMWYAPLNGEMVIIASSTAELRTLIRRQPIGRDRAPCG